MKFTAESTLSESDNRVQKGNFGLRSGTPMGRKSNMLNRHKPPINPYEEDGLFGVGSVGRQS
jgi:hypothetical protein